jgi:hypothetical protein
MSHTIFAVYSSLTDAADLRAELQDAGIGPADIRISSGGFAAGPIGADERRAIDDLLAGVPADDLTFYRESLERGRTVVRVQASDMLAEKVSQMLDHYGPITQREAAH